MWPFKKKPIKKEIAYPVYLCNNDDNHYIIIYNDREGYHFSLKDMLQGKIRAYVTSTPILYQYTTSTLYKPINEDEFIDALDNCTYLPKKEKLYILIKK